MSDRYALWDAAYVLGSLSSTERREYESHLHGCVQCRSAVGELSGMPALLNLLGPADAASIDDRGLESPPMPPQLLDDLLAQVARRRNRARRWAWMATAAAAAAVIAALLIVVRPGPVAPPAAEPAGVATSLSMTTVAPSSLEATMRVTSRGWGTHIEMTCTYHPDTTSADDAGDTLAMVAVGRDGTRVQLATWTAHEGATASPSGSTSIPVDQIAAVQVVSADSGNVLLQRNL